MNPVRRRQKTLTGSTLLLMTLAMTVSVQAEDEEVTGTTIIGTKEAPNVLNVVPWQGKELSADPWEIRPSPAQSVLEESLQPIDRDVLRREIEYFNLIQQAE